VRRGMVRFPHADQPGTRALADAIRAWAVTGGSAGRLPVSLAGPAGIGGVDALTVIVSAILEGNLVLALSCASSLLVESGMVCGLGLQSSNRLSVNMRSVRRCGLLATGYLQILALALATPSSRGAAYTHFSAQPLFIQNLLQKQWQQLSSSTGSSSVLAAAIGACGGESLGLPLVFLQAWAYHVRERSSGSASSIEEKAFKTFSPSRDIQFGTTIDPLVFTTMASAIGTSYPLPMSALRALLAREAENKAQSTGGAGEDEYDESIEDDLFSLSMAQADPLAVAALVARGKKALPALRQGSEDCVVLYYRFERPDAEQAAEDTRKSVLSRKGGLSSAAGGVWGLRSEGFGDLSPWPAPLVDLSKRKNMDGFLFDAVVGSGASSVGGGSGTPAGSWGASASVRLAMPAKYDGPTVAGDPAKVRPPRVLAMGLHEPSKGDFAALANCSNTASAAYNALGVPHSLMPPHPASPYSACHEALRRLRDPPVAWAAVVPLLRFSHSDIGIRPFDPAAAVFTIEMWVRLGSGRDKAAAAEATQEGYDDGHSDDDDRMASASTKSSLSPLSALSLNPSVVVLASRVERMSRPTSASPSAVGGARTSVQWQLIVRPDGALAFDGFPSAPVGIACSVASAAGAVKPHQWVHVAVTVDATNAARGVQKALRTPTLPATLPPLDAASVRLFVGGKQVAEGTVRTARPLPLLLELPAAVRNGHPLSPEALAASSASHSSMLDSLPPHWSIAGAADRAQAGAGRDLLLLGPNLIGCLSEVRVWLVRRSAEELSGSGDFPLDLAESKKSKLQVVIRAAAPPAAAAVQPPPSSADARASAALPLPGSSSAFSALPPLGSTATAAAPLSLSLRPPPAGQPRLTAPAPSAALARRLGGGGGGSAGVTAPANTAVASSASDIVFPSAAVEWTPALVPSSLEATASAPSPAADESDFAAFGVGPIGSLVGNSPEAAEPVGAPATQAVSAFGHENDFSFDAFATAATLPAVPPHDASPSAPMHQGDKGAADGVERKADRHPEPVIPADAVSVRLATAAPPSPPRTGETGATFSSTPSAVAAPAAMAGLALPPPGVGGGKKAALLRAAAGRAGAAATASAAAATTAAPAAAAALDAATSGDRM
jgi:hypothetical protein